MKEKIIILREEELDDYESRMIAKNKKAKRYRTTIPCDRGHCSTRITATTHCYECFALKMKNSPPARMPTRSVRHIDPAEYDDAKILLLKIQASR